jgi:hypothetical protein
LPARTAHYHSHARKAPYDIDIESLDDEYYGPHPHHYFHQHHRRVGRDGERTPLMASIRYGSRRKLQSDVAGGGDGGAGGGTRGWRGGYAGATAAFPAGAGAAAAGAASPGAWMARFAGCLVLTVVILLVIACAAGVFLAMTKPLLVARFDRLLSVWATCVPWLEIRND